jgi:aspartyl protease family protein
MLNLVLLVIVIAAMIILVMFGEGEKIAGLEPSLFASLVSASAFGLLVLSWGASEFQGRWREAARNAALWVLILFGLMAAYAYRFDFQDVANRVLAEIAPGYVVMARGGEVTIVRSGSGSFLIAGRINGRDARMIFDTGASQVVLTDATARAAGIDPSSLNYSVNVSTANGRTTAAPVRLDRLDIGPISETRVQALVARPGALSENLLGMSFLERLTSYEVRDDKLVLRGGR